MSWQDQGRQEHGWFGSGTSMGTTDGSDTSGGGVAGLVQRAQSVAYGAIAALPPMRRQQAERQLQSGGLARLTAAMSGWVQGSRLDEARFAAHFFGRSGSDPVPAQLHAMAIRLGMSGSQTTLANAATSLSDIMQTIGLDRWQAFLADAGARADAPATHEAIAALDRPKPAAPDAITPVYPVETGLAMIGAGLAGGAAAIGRTVGSAVVRQFVPKQQPIAAETAADILMPGGKPIGSKGSTNEIRELAGGLDEARRLYARLTRGASNVTTARDKGIRMQTPDGGFITLREASKSGPPTIDLNLPGIGLEKLKFPRSME